MNQSQPERNAPERVRDTVGAFTPRDLYLLIAAVAPAIVGVVLATAGVPWAVLLLAGRAMVLGGCTLVLSLLLYRGIAWNRLLTLAGMSTLSGALVEAGVRSLARPLTANTGVVVAGVFLLALVVVGRHRLTHILPVTAGAVFLTAGLVGASALPTSFDISLVLSSGAAALLPLAGVSVLVARLRGLTLLGTAGRWILAAIGAAGLYGSVRAAGFYALDGDTNSSSMIVTALVLAVSALTLAAAAIPVSVLKSHLTLAAVAVPLTLATLAASAPSLLPLERDPREGLDVVEAAAAADQKLVAGMTGEVGAGPRPEFRGKSFYECDALNSRDCFITHFDDIALRRGVAAAVADVVDKVKTNKGATFPAHCHQVVHNLGQLAYQLADQFGDAADLDPQVCGTGYTHGLWEQQFALLGTEVMFKRTGSLCTELNMVSDWYKWTCHHILGHMMSADLSTDPTTATEYCIKVEDPQGLTDCLTGGWMNFFQDDVVIARMRASGDLKELFGVCYGAPESTKFFCYQELFPVIYSMIDGDDFAAGQACLDYAEPPRGEGLPWTLTAQNYADRCVQGLARGIGASSAQNPVLMAMRCQDMPEKAVDPCMVAAAASYVLNTGGATTAFNMCKQVTDDAYREYCYFWTKHARALLANGPNSENLPDADEVRLPEVPGLSAPGQVVVPSDK